MTIHHAAHGFDRSADAYERGRPGYPPETVRHLATRVGIRPGAIVVDVAAGTGKLTRELIGTGARIIAVEPVAAMRERLADAVPEAEIRAGTAEHLPFDTGSVDAITVGQAFHWFDGHAALAEMHRVLTPGGGLGLIWNRRDLSQPIQARLHALLDEHRGDAPSFMSGRWRLAFERTSLFTPLQGATATFEQVLDGEGLVARVLSTSFVSLLAEADRARLIDEVRSIANAEEAVRLRYITETYWCRRS